MALPGVIRQIIEGREEDLETIRHELPRIAQLIKDRDRLLALAEKCQLEIDALILEVSDGLAAAELRTAGKVARRSSPSVREMVLEVLEQSPKPLTATGVKQEIVRRYPHRDREGFYVQVYVALRRHKLIKRLKDKRYKLARRSARG